jgi:outer membrane protein assembly factor BamB
MLSGRRSVAGVVAAVVALLGVVVGTTAPAGSQVVQHTVSARGGSATEVNFPAFMHDAGHSGFSPDATAITPTSTLNMQWTFQEKRIRGFPPRFFATPLVIQGVIYIGSNSGEFYAINLSTGAVIWKEFIGVEVKAPCRQLGILATAASGIDPTTGALAIYAASGDGNIYALRASDGTILWKSPVNVPDPGTNDYFAYSSPEIANGKIYEGISSMCDMARSPITIAGGRAELDQATGSRLATYHTVPAGHIGGSVWASPAIAADGSVFVVTGDGNGVPSTDTQGIVKLNPKSLARLDSWQILPDRDSDFGGSPTVFTANLNGVATPMVGACNKNGLYYAWKQSALSAGPVWTTTISSKVNSTGNCLSTAVWDGSDLYVAGPAATISNVYYRGSMRKLNPATGAALWTAGLPAALVQSPTLDGAGALAASSYDVTSATNTAFLIDAATGAYKLVNDGNVPAPSTPVFGDQYLVIPNVKGAIYVYAAQ